MSNKSKLKESPVVSVEDILWLVNGKEFKCFRETDGNLTVMGEKVLQRLIDILYLCQDFGFKYWKNMNIDMIEQQITDIVRRGY